MLSKTICAGALALILAGTAQARTIIDPTNDFIASYTGPLQSDLDVTSLAVSYNQAASLFTIQSTMAGAINPLLGGFYAIGVNTGTGAGPFGPIGAPNVLFNRVIAVQKAGTATIGGVPLAAGSVTIGGNALSVVVPLALLPSTGFAPNHYAFNIWPRSGPGGFEVISDFAPDNATLAAVPEPASWAMMVGGLGLLGGALRRQRARLRLV